jgi:hypothetical protein
LHDILFLDRERKTRLREPLVGLGFGQLLDGHLADTTGQRDPQLASRALFIALEKRARGLGIDIVEQRISSAVKSAISLSSSLGSNPHSRVAKNPSMTMPRATASPWGI